MMMQGDREMQQEMKPQIQMDLQVVQVEFDHTPFSDNLCDLVPRINKTYLENTRTNDTLCCSLNRHGLQ